MICIEYDIIMSLALMDEKLSALLNLQTYDDNPLSIDHRDIILPSFDASQFDDSNELSIVFL